MGRRTKGEAAHKCYHTPTPRKELFMYSVDSITKGPTTYFFIKDDAGVILDAPTKFLKHKQHLGRQKRTLEVLARKLAWYFNFLDEIGLSEADVRALNFVAQQEHFIDFLHWVKAGEHTSKESAPNNATANAYLEAVLDYYDFATRRITYTNPVGLKFSKYVRAFEGYLPEHHSKAASISAEEIKVLLDNCTNLRDKLLILLLEETGLRIGELLGVRYSKDIDYENHKIFVRFRLNENGAAAKYREERGLLISPETFEVLLIYLAQYASLLKDTDYLFVSAQGKPLSIKSVYSMFDRLERRCGVHSHCHALRHYYANERRKAGWDIAMISRSLGHRHIATTEAYLNVSDDELLKASTAYFKQANALVDVGDLI